MKPKKTLGWLILLLLSFSPTIPWYFLGPKVNLFTYANFTHALGQLAALIGMTMFALTFVLSTRIKLFEDIFGGLDKVYIVHAVLGGTALTLLLFHPILLVLKFIPQDINLAAQYLWFSNFWSVNFGIFALLGLILLLFITFFTKIKYNKWKFTHEFLGLIFMFAILHIFMVRNVASRDYIFKGYYVFAAIVSIIGLFAFFYSLFLKSRSKALFTVKSINRHNKMVHDIVLTPKYKPIEYRSGQFIFLRFLSISNEAHPFSVTSKSNSTEIRVVIKNLGDYTSKLNKVKVGEAAIIEGPYGRFNHIGSKDADQVWLAGGIGITPFIGMAKELKASMKNKIELYYSVKTPSDFVSLDDFQNIESKTGGKFRIIPWVTKEKGHIDIKKILGKNIDNKEFYLCGPGGFKNALSASLLALGVSKTKIYMEEFSFK